MSEVGTSGTSSPVNDLKLLHAARGRGARFLEGVRRACRAAAGEDREVIAAADIDGAFDVNGALFNEALKPSGALHPAFELTGSLSTGVTSVCLRGRESGAPCLSIAIGTVGLVETLFTDFAPRIFIGHSGPSPIANRP